MAPTRGGDGTQREKAVNRRLRRARFRWENRPVAAAEALGRDTKETYVWRTFPNAAQVCRPVGRPPASVLCFRSHPCPFGACIKEAQLVSCTAGPVSYSKFAGRYVKRKACAAIAVCCALTGCRLHAVCAIVRAAACKSAQGLPCHADASSDRLKTIARPAFRPDF